FWDTVKAKTVNGEVQLQALVDKNKNVLDSEKAKTAQDSEIASLKKKVKKLERRNKSRLPGSKGRKIADIDADVEVTLIDETQGRNDDNLMFDTSVSDEQEVEVEKVVSTAEVTTESATTTTVDELTLAQTLIEIKAAKPKVKGGQEDKARQNDESEKPVEEGSDYEEEANIALIESWDNTHAMMDADYQIAQQLQAEEHEQLKGFKFEVIKDMFDKAFKRVNTFVDYKTGVGGVVKRVQWLVLTDGSAKTYLFFSQLLREFDREDLENLWKLVKAKHRNTRPKEGYERVLWGDLKTMFKHHIEDEVWRSLQGKKVLL
ncbi:hypothetical protein Tco_0824819, partial [Tanacetum coccineum]